MWFTFLAPIIVLVDSANLYYYLPDFFSFQLTHLFHLNKLSLLPGKNKNEITSLICQINVF